MRNNWGSAGMAAAVAKRQSETTTPLMRAGHFSRKPASLRGATDILLKDGVKPV